MMSIMFKFLSLGLVISFCTLSGSTSSIAELTYNIGPIDAISLSGSPKEFHFSMKRINGIHAIAFDHTTTYAVTTNNLGRKILAQLTNELPKGVALSVELTPPVGAVSSGLTHLSTQSVELVGGISTVAQKDLPIVYRLDVKGNVRRQGKTEVVYTIAP